MLRAPRLIVLAAACLSAAAIQAAPLKDLTQDVVRDRVRAYLTAYPDAQQTLAKDAGFALTLDPALVAYRAGADGTPEQLLWQYVVTAAPTTDQQTAAAVALARVLDEALGQGSGAVLNAADVQTVRVQYRFQPVTTTARQVYWPSYTPAVAYGPWVSYSPGPVYFTSYQGTPFAVGEYRFAYNPIHYLEPSAFFSYWATWPYRPYGVYAPYYNPSAYWGYWGTYPPNGWAVPTGRPVYYLPPAIMRAEKPDRDALARK